MRDPKRIPRILLLFEKIWLKSPDMRFGQLCENLISEYCNNRGIVPTKMQGTMWIMEDADFEVFLKLFKGFGNG